MIYRLIRLLDRLALAVFFRRIEVVGREHLPERGGVLLVANHLNAFVDGLLVRTSVERPVWLTAKATLRRNPVMRLIMALSRVVALKRREDQQGTSGNLEALEHLAQLVARGEQVGIFPEGVSHSEGRLRPFKTGAARLILEANELARAASGPPPVVVPVGLVYLEKSRFRSEVVVRFGPPLDLAQLAPVEREVPALTARLEQELAWLAVPIPPERAELLRWVTELVARGGAPPARLGERPGDLAGYVALLDRLASGYDQLGEDQLADVRQRALALYDLTKGARLSAAEVFLPLSWWRVAVFVVREIEVLLVAGPLAAWGYLNHLLPYLGTRRIVALSAKDEDHVATQAVFFGLPLFVACYAVQTAIVLAAAGLGWAAAYLLTLPYFGAVALLFRDRAFDARQRLASFFALSTEPARRQEIQRQAQALIGDIHMLLANHLNESRN